VLVLSAVLVVAVMAVWGVRHTDACCCGCRVGGEYVVKAFDDDLKADLAAGRERQAKMNKRDGIDLKKITSDVRHSWQWNDELSGWKERKELQKKRCVPCAVCSAGVSVCVGRC
jgi:hypothetical protein